MPLDGLRDGWLAALGGRPRRIVFSDGTDPRVLRAAERLADTPVTPLLLGRTDAIVATAAANGVRLDRVPVLDTAALARDGAYTDVIASSVRGRTAPAGLLTDDLYQAMAAVRLGVADGAVVGSARPTADAVRAALRVVGLAGGVRTLSSSFLMLLPDGRRFGFGDCAVVPEPDAEQLADIARATSTTFATLTGERPVVAMLSFSTMGSARHPSVERVRAATAMLRAHDPDLAVDGELQFDAAVIESIARSKARDSAVAGHANVLVFPNLDAGNIGYKITERLAGAVALGPILQGLAAPVNDLSRGCSADDVETVGLVTAMQATHAGVPATERGYRHRPTTSAKMPGSVTTTKPEPWGA